MPCLSSSDHNGRGVAVAIVGGGGEWRGGLGGYRRAASHGSEHARTLPHLTHPLSTILKECCPPPIVIITANITFQPYLIFVTTITTAGCANKLAKHRRHASRVHFAEIYEP